MVKLLHKLEDLLAKLFWTPSLPVLDNTLLWTLWFTVFIFMFNPDWFEYCIWIYGAVFLVLVVRHIRRRYHK